jgi:murein DD-endopeptidase MepM/ murein hydrolase activator NlpD
MLRLLLAIVLAAVIGGMGFYLGRSSVVTDRVSASQAARPPMTSSWVEPPANQTRSRTETRPLPAPPAVTPEVDLTSPTLPAQEPGQAPGDSALLFDRALGLPIVGLREPDIRDTFAEARGGGERRHEATDIIAPRGTPVVAVDTGIVAKLFNSKAGGLTVYQFDPAQNYAYYYAHLDRYAEGLKEGMLLKKGDRIGFVGTTGNADPNTPHLHFGIFQLGPEKRWWEGKPINPYPLLRQAVGR